MFKERFASIIIGIVGLILAGVQVWDILERRGISGAAFAVIVWVVAFGMIAYAVYRNLKDARRAAQLHSEIVTIKDEYKIHIEALEKKLALGKPERLELEPATSNPPTATIKGSKSLRVRNMPRLWVEYKPATKKPPQREALIFSKDEGAPIRYIQVGPLTWNVTETRPISLFNVIGVLRSDPIECGFTAYEQDGLMQRLFELPGLMREMMSKFGVTAQPTAEVSFEDMEGNGFCQDFVLSIDPDNRIVWEPNGSLRLR